MFEMTKETGAFHNIYKTGIGAETEKRILHEGNVSAPSDLKKTFCRSIIVLRAAMNVNWKVAQSAF